MLKRSLTGKTVLITGGAGFIGSHLVDAVIEEEPADIVLVDNLYLGQETNIRDARVRFPGLRFVEHDAGDYDAMAGLVGGNGVDVIFDMAVLPLPMSLERPAWVTERNVATTTTACELLRNGHAQALVHFSSSEAYGTARSVPMSEAHPLVPITPYAASKLAGDHIVDSYVATFGLDAVTVRPFNNYGPRQNDRSYAGIIPIVINRALNGQPITIHGDGEQTRDFLFVTDTARGAIAAYGSPGARGRTINVASGRETTVNELVRLLLDALGTDVPIVREPERPGDVRRHLADISLARTLLEWAPTVSLDQGIQQTVDFYVRRSRNEAANA